MLDAGFVPVEVLAPAVLPEPLLVMEAAGAVLAGRSVALDATARETAAS